MVRIWNVKELLLLCLAGLLWFIPWTNKPFIIDSPVTIYAATQMNIDPINPPIGDYGKMLSFWNHTDLPVSSAYHATPHPLLLPLYIAPFIAIFGPQEWVCNSAMFLFYCLTIVFMYGLCVLIVPKARIWATLLFMMCPAVSINAQNVMNDMPLAAFTMGTFFFMFRSEHIGDALCAGVCAGLACLTKFTAGALIVPCAWYYISKKQPHQLVGFVAPFLVLNAGWFIHNYIIFGKSQLLSNGHAHYIIGDIRYRLERLVSFAGSTIIFPAIPIIYGLFIKNLKLRTMVFLAGSAIWSGLLMYHLHYSFWAAFFYLLCATSGVLLISMDLMLQVKCADKHMNQTLVLHVFLQIVGGLFLTLYATRYLFPIIFCFILTIAAYFESIQHQKLRKSVYIIAIGTSAIVSIVLSMADMMLAQADCRIATDVKKKFPEKAVYYNGRCGYMYYMDKAGCQNVLTAPRVFGPGDIFVHNTQYYDDSIYLQSIKHRATPIDTFTYPVWPLQTIGGRAGFYGNDRLPYSVNAFGRSFVVFLGL